ncbi:MAG: acetyl-CoA acetyltransferase [Caulobacteraceae bacterium]|nr:acetyl-CoA acetyltransferase [Caulobacteraceae bacterium]
MRALEKTTAITGVGQSQLGRRLNRTGLELTVESTMRAIADAGLKPSDIDGICCWPGRNEHSLGMGPTSAMEMKEALGLNLNWYFAGSEGPAQMSSVMMASMAVASGLARHVLVFRTLIEATMQTPERRASQQAPVNGRITGPYSWMMPYNAPSAANWLAMVAQRRFHEFGLTREQMAQVALNGRRNAQLNPDAVMRGPLTLDDYMSSRMITTPLCLFDCDIPMDGSIAVIVSHVDDAKDMPQTPVRIEAMSATLHDRFSWDQREDLTSMASNDAGARLWERTDFKPKDVDIAELYDGFSVLSLIWLESLGFCGRGESGAFVEGGKRIALDGELPLNTHGGQLSAGRMHGFGYIQEAVLQLRGQAGERQVKNDPKVAVVANGGGPLAACMLLARD